MSEQFTPELIADCERIASLGEVAQLAAIAEAAERYGVPERRIKEILRAAAKDAKQAATGQAPPLEQDSMVDVAPPCDGPANLGAALERASEIVAAGLICSEHVRHVICLWVACTYVRQFNAAPLLIFDAPTPEAGKSVGLELTRKFSQRRLAGGVVSPTEASFFRLNDAHSPTWCIDEADLTFRMSSEAPDLAKAINAGYKRPACILRCVGDNHDVKYHDVFGWRALAGINLSAQMPPATVSRSIVCRLSKKLPGEKVISANWPSAELDQRIEAIRRQFARAALDNAHRVGELGPGCEARLPGRLGEIWAPLMVIAELAGGDWPARAMAAMRSFEGERDQTPAPSVQLLADISALLEETANEVIGSGWLHAGLLKLEESPWLTWRGRGGPFTAKDLATFLRGLGIVQRQIRVGSQNIRGFRRDAFDDAFARYLPTPSPKRATSATSATEAAAVPFVAESPATTVFAATEYRNDCRAVAGVAAVAANPGREGESAQAVAGELALSATAPATPPRVWHFPALAEAVGTRQGAQRDALLTGALTANLAALGAPFEALKALGVSTWLAFDDTGAEALQFGHVATWVERSPSLAAFLNAHRPALTAALPKPPPPRTAEPAAAQVA